MNKILLLDIQYPLGEPVADPVSKTHWRLKQDYQTLRITDCGVLESNMYTGWITDFRSGSRPADLVIPKIGKGRYTATVLGHDEDYSGWISKDLADSLFYQGLLLSGISKCRAELAYQAVSKLGWLGYVPMDEDLKGIYKGNRTFERFYWRST